MALLAAGRLVSAPAMAQDGSPGAASASASVWRYTLLPGSQFLDDCLICDRLTVALSMRGTADLRWLDENPLFTRYAVENISWEAGTPGGAHYTITGQGEFQIGGEVALVQELALELQIDDGYTNQTAWFTNTTPMVRRPWPGLEVSCYQTNGTLLQTFSLDLAAAPFRDIWFSTVSSMTPDDQTGLDQRISAGDLISFQGQLVKTNGSLTGLLGIAPPPLADLGLDALDMLPGAEIAFSTDQDARSESLGLLQHGDLLSQTGRVLHRGQDLLSPFSPMPPLSDVGLDAVHILENGDVYFSIETSLFSQKLGVTLRPGDLLSSRGEIVRTQEQLLSRFRVVTGPGMVFLEPGLDAVYVWPNNEIWFSTENAFDDADLGTVLGGDLLSDQGYIVVHNLDLVGAFSPLEDLADFGLDALFVVTDVTPPAPEPRLTALRLHPKGDGLRLEWAGSGRVFQVESARRVEGPYQPYSPLLPDLFFEQDGLPTQEPEGYFRLRQW